MKKKNNKVNFILKSYKYLIIIFILIELYYPPKIQRNKIKDVINDAILPLTDKEHIVKKYNISYKDLKNQRYNFEDFYNKRKIFKINYSYLPYKKIDKSISYKNNAENIYNSTGMLNITKLDYYYNNTDTNTLNYNHIHLSMSFDKNYTELSTISIASILNTSSPDTYIHLHILGFNFDYETMEKIIQLKRINKNVEFVFYNGKQAEYDFGEKISNDTRQIADYGKILAPQIVNNTNRILIIDSEDVIIQKDISEIFYYDLGDNYIAWILDIIAGNYKKKYNSFFSNNFYPNGGVMLVNIRLFRKDNLYKRAFYMPILYNNLYTPVQDILLSITNYKFKYMPLIFNSNIAYWT